MTKYYVRTFDCGEFQADDYTENEFLFIESSGTYIETATNMMPAVPFGSSEYFRLFTICAESGTQKTPRNRTTDIHLSKLSQSGLGSPESGTGVIVHHNTPNLLGVWENYNWTNPDNDITTFTNELCNFFNTAKVTDSSIYGTDNDEINLYIITWIESGTKRYLPLFKMGNDSNYDQIIEI